MMKNMRTTIVTDSYVGPDRRGEPRLRIDRRKTVVIVYDENGEPTKERGQLVDIIA